MVAGDVPIFVVLSEWDPGTYVMQYSIYMCIFVWLDICHVYVYN